MFGVPSSPGFVLGCYLQEVVFQNSPSDHEIWSIWCHVGIHVDLTYSVGPSSIVWSELRPAPPSPPMRVLEVQRSHAISLVCEVALNQSTSWLVLMDFVLLPKVGLRATLYLGPVRTLTYPMWRPRWHNFGAKASGPSSFSSSRTPI